MEKLTSEKLKQMVTNLKMQGVIKRDADISKALTISKGNLSSYLNGKLKPSAPFIDAFKREYSQYLNETSTKLDSSNEIELKHALQRIADLEDHIKTLKALLAINE